MVALVATAVVLGGAACGGAAGTGAATTSVTPTSPSVSTTSPGGSSTARTSPPATTSRPTTPAPRPTTAPRPGTTTSAPRPGTPRPTAPRPTTPHPTIPPRPTTPSGLPAHLSGTVVSRIPTSSKVVALTFDAGANGDGVPSILATLRAQGVPASFYLTGDFVRAYPTLARQVAAYGRIGNHTDNHLHMTTLADTAVRTEVSAGYSAIVATTGRSPKPLFRFPFGEYTSHTLSLVNSMGYVAVGWTVDSLGWKGTSGGQTADAVVARVVAARTPGEIVLMHVGSNPQDHTTLDAAALPRVISQLRAYGYSFVTLSALGV